MNTHGTAFDPSSIIQFFARAEKLKTRLRHSVTSDLSRPESSAEHSWMLPVLAILVIPNLQRKCDEARLVNLVVFHDLPEAGTEDTRPWDKEARKTKFDREKAALIKILEPLAQESQQQIMDLWLEYGFNETYEAHIAHALDKAEVLMQHNLVDISSWTSEDYLIGPYYCDEAFDLDPYLRALKDRINDDTMHKIEAAGALDLVTEHARELWTARKAAIAIAAAIATSLV